jgi:hypothetical protein
MAQKQSVTGPVIDLKYHPNRVGGATPILTGLIMTTDGMPSTVARMSGTFGFEVSYKLARKPRDLRVGVVLENQHGVRVTAISPTFEDPHLLDSPPSEGRVRAEVPAHNLVADTYSINVYIESEGLSDCVLPAGSLVIEADDVFSSNRGLENTIAVTYQKCLWSKSW